MNDELHAHCPYTEERRIHSAFSYCPMSSEERQPEEPEYYSVVLIGSSGGGTATLGHTDPVGLLTTIHRELLRIRDDKSDPVGAETQKRICIGLSYAIFVSLIDGGGFDSVEQDCRKPADGSSTEYRGPQAALFTVGFHHSNQISDDESAHNQTPGDIFRVHQTATGPLSKINAEVKKLDEKLSSLFQSQDSHIRAVIALSSEPSLLDKTFTNASKKSLPIAGSGGTSLGILASNYDMKIIGNSGGSVASTTLTKARGWARGLAEEWDMTYDATYNPDIDMPQAKVEKNDATNSMPSLKSILEAALPSFLFLCLSLHFIHLWFPDMATESSCSNSSMQQHHPITVLQYALRHIVLGTTCCVLSATGRSKDTADQSTLLIAATLAGIISSSSASLAADITSCGGGSSLAGLIAGACVPPVMYALSNFCIQYHVTATMTNILLAGGVGTSVGLFMHLSGLSYIFGVMTGLIRCHVQWRRLNIIVSDDDIPWLVHSFLAKVEYIQGQWVDLIKHLELSSLFYSPQSNDTSAEFLSVPIGLGFICGCIFVYGSKIGWYHSVFLPLILIEMDGTSNPSLLGAMDQCALVMVCAGICAGNLIVSPSKTGGAGHTSLSWQALKTNILCGDFIEAAYPYMDKSMLINGSAYLAAGLSCEILLQKRILGTAYLPLPIAIWLSSDRLGMCTASLISFGICFVGSILSNITKK